MNKNELNFILQEGEGLKLEFKESISNLDKELVAFANSEGGRIFLGITDDGIKKEIEITNKLKSQIQDIANNCDPKIKIKLEEFNHILIIHVEEGIDKPYKCKEGFFIRIGPNSQKMRRNEIIDLIHESGKIKFDELINKEFRFPKDFDEKKFRDFLKAAKVSINLPIKNILINMDLAKKQGKKTLFKNTVALMFSNEIKKFHSSAYTTCVLFKGDNRSNIIDRKDFEGSLIEQIEDAVSFVEKNIMLTYQIKSLRRKEISQYPVDAIREAIVNAIMHRDYFGKGSNVFVYIYDGFIEIVNPGGLFGITKNQLGKICARRNERIADLFKMVGLVEKAGTGIQRMKDAMLKAGLKEPKIEPSENFFMITFYGYKREELGRISEGRDIIELNHRQKKAMEYLKEKEFITNTDYQKLCETTKKTASRDLAELVVFGILARKGFTGKGTKYYLAASKGTKGDKGDKQ